MPRRLLSICVCLSFAGGASAAPRAAEFPEPPALRSPVAFWTRVYLEVTTEGGLIHDSKYLGVVYESIRFGNRKGRRARQRFIDNHKQVWRAMLRRLARGGATRDESEAAMVRLLGLELGHPPTARDFNAASRRLRFQLGQRDKFRKGIIRSGAHEDAMRATFRHQGLPEDLAYLPHVESSFNPHAYSKYGAAGLWQFMRSTGRRYLKIDYEVDERLDPVAATSAAARLLKENYRALGSWPLAITAYNHGRTGMKRAKRKVGTDDIGVIVQKYRSRTFGFASRNFYAQFLAARRILKSYESYFGPLARDKPEAVDEVKLPFYASVNDLREHLGIEPDVVRHYNPALRRPVFQSGKRIPEGYVLRLPAGTLGPDTDQWLAAIPPELRHAEQHRSRYYQVRRGDTLGRIARRHGTRVSTLVALNNLPSRHRIYRGQVLQLPDRDRAKPPPAPKRGLVRSAQAAPAPRPKPQTETAQAAPAPKPKPQTETAQATPEPEPKPQTETAQATPAPEPEPQTETAQATPEPEPKLQTETAQPAPAPEPVPETAAAAPTAPARPAPPLTAAIPELPKDSPWQRIEGNAVIVDADETLGHFADWLDFSTQRLRSLNGIRYGRKLHIGQRLKLDFSRVRPERFLERRMEYHKGIEEDFLGSYRVAGTVEHELRRGDSLWELAHKIYRVPTWLIRRYNPEADLDRLVPGDKLVIPVVERL